MHIQLNRLSKVMPVGGQQVIDQYLKSQWASFATKCDENGYSGCGPFAYCVSDEVDQRLNICVLDVLNLIDRNVIYCGVDEK